MGRYECKLDPQAKEKAINELNEPEENDARLAAIDEARKQFKTNYPQLTLLREDDEFILRFLRVKKYNIANTTKMLKNYHAQRAEWPELFEKVNIPFLLQDVLRAGVVLPLPEKSKEGCAVVLTWFGKNQTSLIDAVALIYLTFEHLLQDEYNQIYGFIMVHDFSNVGMLDPRFTKRLMNVLFNSQPIRIKKVFFLRQSIFFGTMFSVLTAVLDEKMKSKFVVAGKNYSLIHEAIDEELLPQSMGGKGEECNPKTWKNTIFDEFRQSHANRLNIQFDFSSDYSTASNGSNDTTLEVNPEHKRRHSMGSVIACGSPTKQHSSFVKLLRLTGRKKTKSSKGKKLCSVKLLSRFRKWASGAFSRKKVVTDDNDDDENDVYLEASWI